MTGMREFFATQPTFGAGQPEPDRSAAHAGAESRPIRWLAQLEYMRGRWGIMLGQYLYRVLGGLDFIHEEEKADLHRPRPDDDAGVWRGGAARVDGVVRPGGQQLRARAGAGTLQRRSRLDAAPRA